MAKKSMGITGPMSGDDAMDTGEGMGARKSRKGRSGKRPKGRKGRKGGRY